MRFLKRLRDYCLAHTMWLASLLSSEKAKEEGDARMKAFMSSDQYYEIVNKNFRERGIAFQVHPPPKDKCPYQILPNVYCCRPFLSGFNFCYWHAQTTDKYRPEVVEEYFGSGQSLKGAVESEVAQKHTLKGAYLREASLGGSAFLPGVNLAGADLREADLSEAKLSYGSLKGASLQGASLESAFLSDVDIRGVLFHATRLYNTKFRNNDFEGVKGLTKECFRGWKWRLIPEYRILEQYPEYSVGVYRAMVTYFAHTGALDDASWAAYRERVAHRSLLRKKLSLNQCAMEILFEETGRRRYNRLQRIALLLTRSVYRFTSLVMSCLYGYVSGYGEKPLRVAASAALAIALYAIFYAQAGAISESGFTPALYFSVVTFTTLGYGDLKPLEEFRLFAASEALLGVVLTGLFLFTLSRRASGRG